MFQASLLAPVSARAGLRPAGVARIPEHALRINHQPAGWVTAPTHMEGKDNEKMVIVDNAWPVEHPAVGLWL